MFEYKTEKELSEMTEKEREQYLVDKRKHEKELIEQKVEKEVSEGIKEATKDLATKKDLEGISDEIKSMKVSNGGSQKTMDSYLSENKEKLQKELDQSHRGNGRMKVMEIKNVPQKGMTTYGVMGATPSTTDGALAEMSGMGQIIAPEIRQSELDEFFTVSNWQNDSYTYREYVRDVVEGSGPPAVEGFAAHVNERQLKPELQWKLQKTTATYKKAAGHQIYTTEIPIFMEQVYEDTVNLLRGDVLAEYDEQMMSFVIAAATALDTTGFTSLYTAPSLYHVLTIAAAKSINYRGDRAFRKTNPNAIMINPLDLAHMKLAEDADGNLAIPIFHDVANNKFGSMLRLIESTEITEGEFVLGDLKKIKVKNILDYRAEAGRINDQLITNEFTVVGEKLYIPYIESQYTGGLIKGDIAAIKTAITKP